MISSIIQPEQKLQPSVPLANQTNNSNIINSNDNQVPKSELKTNNNTDKNSGTNIISQSSTPLTATPISSYPMNNTTTTTTGSISSTLSNNGISKNSSKSKRVKTGCLTCRRKHRKCDEMKKAHSNGNFKCSYCSINNLDCSWPDFININLVSSPPSKSFNTIDHNQNQVKSPGGFSTFSITPIPAKNIMGKSPESLISPPPSRSNYTNSNMPVTSDLSIDKLLDNNSRNINNSGKAPIFQYKYMAEDKQPFTDKSKTDMSSGYIKRGSSEMNRLSNPISPSTTMQHAMTSPLNANNTMMNQSRPMMNQSRPMMLNQRSISGPVPTLAGGNPSSMHATASTRADSVSLPSTSPSNPIVSATSVNNNNNNNAQNKQINEYDINNFAEILEPTEPYSIFDYSLFDDNKDDYLDFPMTLKEFMYVNALNINSNSNLAGMAASEIKDDQNSSINHILNNNGQLSNSNGASNALFTSTGDSNTSNSAANTTNLGVLPNASSFFSMNFDHNKHAFPFDLPPSDVLNKYFGNYLRLSKSDVTDNSFHLQPELELVLLKNYVGVVGLGLDIFDDNKVFVQVTPIMMRNSLALKYAILAFGSRFIETTTETTDYPKDLSMKLYEQSLKHLVPSYNSANDYNQHKLNSKARSNSKSKPKSQAKFTIGRTEETSSENSSYETLIITCVTLTVFEMMSTDPKVWKSNIEGSAILLKTHDINGFSDNFLVRASFWVFARMYICCSILNESKMVLPVEYWLPPSARGKSDDEIELMFSQDGMQAHYIVYLNALVISLIYGEIEGELEFKKRWIEIWLLLGRWVGVIPNTYRSIYEYEDSKHHFPRIFFSNSRALSANQMFHMACIIMLSNKPRTLKVDELTKIKRSLSRSYSVSSSTSTISNESTAPLSPLVQANLGSHQVEEVKIHSTSLPFHAKRIIGISISSNDYAAGTNSIQPLYLAGKIMTSKNEHGVCLGALRGVEKYTGWSTKSRCRDLIEYWSDKG